MVVMCWDTTHVTRWRYNDETWLWTPRGHCHTDNPVHVCRMATFKAQILQIIWKINHWNDFLSNNYMQYWKFLKTDCGFSNVCFRARTFHFSVWMGWLLSKTPGVGPHSTWPSVGYSWSTSERMKTDSTSSCDLSLVSSDSSRILLR